MIEVVNQNQRVALVVEGWSLETTVEAFARVDPITLEDGLAELRYTQDRNKLAYAREMRRMVERVEPVLIPVGGPLSIAALVRKLTDAEKRFYVLKSNL